MLDTLSWVTTTAPPTATPETSVHVMAVADTVHCDMSRACPPMVTVVLTAALALKVPLMVMVLSAKTAPDTLGPAGSKQPWEITTKRIVHAVGSSSIV